jgi:hypothetical protein
MNCLPSWLEDIKDNAKSHIETVNAESRQEVVIYRPLLWVWHRLGNGQDHKRYEFSKVLMQDPLGTGDGRLEVDHCVAVEMWKKMLINEGLTEEMPDYQKKLKKLNSLGNCNLLHKRLNGSKSSDTMSDFLCRITSLNQEGWQQALIVNDQLIHPENYKTDEVLNEIESRGIKIREELKLFVDGKIQRCDVQSSNATQEAMQE